MPASWQPRAGARVVHVVDGGGEGTPGDIRAEIDAIRTEAALIEGEPVVVKQFPKVAVEWRS